MGMMGMFKWLRKDIIQRERNGWNLAPKPCGLNNESYRNALQAFIDRRRFPEDATLETESPCSPDKKRADFLAKNNNTIKCGNEWKQQDSKPIVAGVPHIRASEIFEIGWVAGTEDRYLELIFAEWQNTRVSLKRHTHPECKDAVKADLDVLSEIPHPNILLLMGTTQTDDHGLVSIFESIDCTLYNYIHEQGERISIQGIAKCAGKLSDALRHAHMRGYIHGAISSHCVYLASSGVVKLGGWELAVRLNNPKSQREYEERLRTEIFRWQAPELFHGCEPRKESDVYGLALLIWEMCTMHVPWSGYSRADVERQYVHWKRGVIMDLYTFPPLLNNLLEAGLQLDTAKRTLDMNRMRRFLQRLEMQYEDEEPLYIEQFANNNNETGMTYILPATRSPTGSSKSKNARLIKSASAKQLSYTTKNSETPNKHHLLSKKGTPKQSINMRTIAQMEQKNVFEGNGGGKCKDEIQKNTNVLCNAHKSKRTSSYSSKLEDSDSAQSDEVNSWNSAYRKVRIPTEVLEPRSVGTSTYSVSTPAFDSTDDESYKDARSNLKQLKEILANRRVHFFYGNDTPHASLETSPKTKNKIFTQARSRDYEPHKPASHKTSLEPKCNKSPGQYDPSYLKPSFQYGRRVPYSHTPDNVRDAVMQPQILNSDPQSFFETSLWRKEKSICIAKMRKSSEDDEPTFLFSQHEVTNDTTDTNSNKTQFLDFVPPKSNNTYVISSKNKANNIESSLERSGVSEDINSTITVSSRTSPLKVLKDSLDRATKIVRSITPNTDESCSSPPFKSCDNFELTTVDNSASKFIFEDMYDLTDRNEDEEIKSIERSIHGSETFLLSTNSLAIESDKYEDSRQSKNDTITTESSSVRPNSSAYEASYSRTFVCESIAEVSSEFNVSYNDAKSSQRSEYVTDKDTTAENVRYRNAMDSTLVTTEQSCDESQPETEAHEERPFITKFSLMLLNETGKNKNCKSCHQSALPRRRSLPAALSQLRAVNNSALGKLPIRRAGMPDSTVEDLYIDDEFGDSLNVNMVLLDEDISLDEDFLPEISEL